MSKDMKDYLPYYIGCKVMVNERTLTMRWAASLLQTNAWQKIKLILRPLSDASEKEQGIIDEILKAFDETDAIQVTQGMANVTMFLTKSGFDVFNLIESNLAIDKTKLKNNE